ncbi:MAG: IS630 family transposase [Deltaproteobacteria bacterium]|nr:IS630 family transposase [Deltaproteobacteria bacterium]
MVEQEVTRQAPVGRPVRLMFQDEARFGRINDPRRCWAPRGFRPEAGMQIVREYTYAFGAASPHDGALDTLVLPVVTAAAMSIFLAEVARRHPEEFILMFLDGAGWHRANSLVIPENMKLEALPPYSPQLNPMEHIWDEVREKWFANEVFDSLDGIEDRLVEALVALKGNQDLVASTTGFDWIINCRLTAT